MPALNLGNSSDHQLNDEVEGFGGRVEPPTISVIAKSLRMGNAAKPSIPEQIPVPTPCHQLGTVRLPLDPPQRLDMQESAPLRAHASTPTAEKQRLSADA
jgi:hypothetical protein